MTEQPNIYESDADREADLLIDRAVEAAPLPYSRVRHYANESQRQIDLAAAERANISREAGHLGITTKEWSVLRAKLGRSPGLDDIK